MLTNASLIYQIECKVHGQHAPNERLKFNISKQTNALLLISLCLPAARPSHLRFASEILDNPHH